MVTVRQATTNDVEAVRDLLDLLGYTFTVAAVQDRLALLASTGTDPVLLAVQDGVALGLIALHITTMLQVAQPVARVTALVVQDQGRGTGVGRLLVDAGDELARLAGCGILELTTAVARTDAHAFYRKLGFTNSSLGFKRPIRSISST